MESELADAVIAHIDDLLWRYSRGSKLKSAYDVIDDLLDLRNLVMREAHVAATPAEHTFVVPSKRGRRVRGFVPLPEDV